MGNCEFILLLFKLIYIYINYTNKVFSYTINDFNSL
jgi:hypothetical protein